MRGREGQRKSQRAGDNGTLFRRRGRRKKGREMGSRSLGGEKGGEAKSRRWVRGEGGLAGKEKSGRGIEKRQKKVTCERIPERLQPRRRNEEGRVKRKKCGTASRYKNLFPFSRYAHL